MTAEPHQVIYRPQPFNFVDMQAKADEYLESVRAEASRITESACFRFLTITIIRLSGIR